MDENQKLIAQRLTDLIAYLIKEGKVHNQGVFVKKLKEYASTVTLLKKGDRTLTEAFNKKVCNAFPQVNPDFLLKGAEPMIIYPQNNMVEIEEETLNNDCKKCLQLAAELQTKSNELIEALKRIERILEE